MKSLCITGARSPRLTDIAQVLYHAGLGRAKELQRETDIDMHSWHRHAVPLLRAQNSVGRLWEHMAEELLLANASNGAWGWHDEESVWALAYWADLDPRIYFLLLGQSAESYLAQEMLETPNDFDPDAMLCEWQQRHSHMLEFYLRYPDRCLMVDVEDALLAPSSLHSVLNERWQLLAGKTQPYSDEDLMSEVTPPLQLATFIARDCMLQSDETLERLRQELAAAQYPLLETHRPQVDGMSVAQEKVDYTQIAQFLQTFCRLQAQESQQEQQVALSDTADRTSQAEQEVESSNREHELLLLTLHSTQEDVERNFQQASQAKQEVEHLTRKCGELSVRNEQAEKALDGYAERASQAEQEVKRLNQECAQLLQALHRTQEDFERYVKHCNVQKTVNQELTQRLVALKRVINPVAVAEHAEAKRIGSERTEWSFDHVLVGGTEYPRLNVLSNLSRGALSLEVKSEEFDSWSIDVNRTTGLGLLLPQQRELANGMLELIQTHLNIAYKSRKEIRKWQRGIEKLQKKLMEQPSQLTFEAPKLHHVQLNPDYEHLWITLQQASFSGSKPVDWQFRVSCANVTPQQFGSHPKLEFPRQVNQLFKGWFVESQDSFGEKLELRFALPDAMDGAIWKRLQEHDRQLIQSLLQQLPVILGVLEQQGENLGRSWDEWGKLVGDIRRIFQDKVL